MPRDRVHVTDQRRGQITFRPWRFPRLFQYGAPLRFGRVAGSVQHRIHEPLLETIVAHAGNVCAPLILDTLPNGLPFQLPDQVLTVTALRGRMRRTRYLMCALLALTWTAPLVAQQPTGTIRGRITDNSTQQPIIGVIVTVGGRSAVTGNDGRYTITGVPSGSDLLRAKLIGYQPANQPVMVAGGETVVVDVALGASAVGLSAVVVTGDGVQRPGDITGARHPPSDSHFHPRPVRRPPN